jgi:EmrB/QacA subfamily drug resistance transporter
MDDAFVSTEQRGQRRWLVALVVGLGTFLSALAGSTIALVLPELGRELGVSVDLAGWVMEAYLLAVTVLLLPAGRASDLLGHRGVYLAGFAVFALGSLGSGLAPGFSVLVAARALQGLGGAMIMSTAPALLTTSFPPSERGRALGVVATATYIGLTAVPPLGGLLVSTLGWRWVFYLNVPSAAIIIALGIPLLPRPARPRRDRFDLLGLATLSTGLPLVLAAIVQGPGRGWLSPAIAAMGLGGAALLAAFVAVESRAASPLLRVSLFRSRVFTGAVLSAVANYVALFVPIILLPYYLREGCGYSPATTGVILAAQPMVMAVVASPAGWLSDRIGTRALAASGMALSAVGLGCLATIGAGTGASAVGLFLGVVGLGTGIFISPNSSALMGAAPREEQGVAGGVLAVARNLGMMLGVAAGMTIFAEAGGATGGRWGQAEFVALRTAFVFAACASLAGAFAAALRSGAPRQP